MRGNVYQLRGFTRLSLLGDLSNMATLLLCNSLQVGRHFRFAGVDQLDTVNDAAEIQRILSAGGVLVSSLNGAAAAASVKCIEARKVGAPVEKLNDLMMAAVADQGSNMPKGSNIAAGATSKPDLTSGKRFVLPAATLAANQVMTLAPPGDAAFVANLYPIVAGTRREITRLDAGAFTLAFLNGGPGAGTLATLIASKAGFAVVEWNGIDWELVAASAQ